MQTILCIAAPKFGGFKKNAFLCITKTKSFWMSKNEDIFLRKLKSTANLVVPKGGEVWLYGSRARGDSHEESDWDLLILLNQQAITTADEENIAYPFVLEGWKNNVAVSPQLYTFEEWKRRSFTPYYKNVEHDKLLIR